jgi:hypothetical protein
MDKINFDDLVNHIIPMERFRLKWRFTEEMYDILPQQHLEQLRPIDADASKFLWNYIISVGLHDNIPFKKDFFRTIDKAKVTLENQKVVKKWLYQRGIPFAKEIYLSWDPGVAMIVPWKIFIKYFDSFYYSGSDDLTIIDCTLQWALLFYHEDEIYFGTNKDYEPNKQFDDIDFLW